MWYSAQIIRCGTGPYAIWYSTGNILYQNKVEEVMEEEIELAVEEPDDAVVMEVEEVAGTQVAVEWVEMKVY